ncbi:hypothetical protein KSS87_020905, partial [Heliosperma pusillum]
FIINLELQKANPHNYPKSKRTLLSPLKQLSTLRQQGLCSTSIFSKKSFIRKQIQSQTSSVSTDVPSFVDSRGRKCISSSTLQVVYDNTIVGLENDCGEADKQLKIKVAFPRNLDVLHF